MNKNRTDDEDQDDDDDGNDDENVPAIETISTYAAKSSWHPTCSRIDFTIRFADVMRFGIGSFGP